MSKAKFSCEIEQLPKGEGWRLVMCENGKEVANDTFAAFPRMDAKKGLILAYREAREVAEDWLKTRIEQPGREAPWPELLCRKSLADGNTVSVYSLDFDFSQCFWRIYNGARLLFDSRDESSLGGLFTVMEELTAFLSSDYYISLVVDGSCFLVDGEFQAMLDDFRVARGSPRFFAPPSLTGGE